MILPLRRAHRRIFLILAIVLPALILFGIARRETPAAVDMPHESQPPSAMEAAGR
jgi:hypothetical protein